MKEKVRAWEGLSSSPNSDIMSWQEVSYITRWKKVGTHCQSSLPPSSGPRTRDCKSPSDVSTQVNELDPHLCGQWMVYWFFFYLKVVNSVVFFLNVKIRWLVWKINKILYNPKILSRILLYLSRNNYVLFWFVFVFVSTQTVSVPKPAWLSYGYGEIQKCHLPQRRISCGLAVSAPGIRHLAPVLDLGGFYLPNIHFFYFFHHPFLKHYLSLLLILCGAGQTDTVPTEERTFD